MAAVLAAGTVAGGASIASAKSEQSEKRIELGADESKKDEAFSFGSITDMEMKTKSVRRWKRQLMMRKILVRILQTIARSKRSKPQVIMAQVFRM